MILLTAPRLTQTFLDICICVIDAHSCEKIIFIRFLVVMPIKTLLPTQPLKKKLQSIMLSPLVKWVTLTLDTIHVVLLINLNVYICIY